MEILDFDIMCSLCGSSLKDDMNTFVTAFNCSNEKCIAHNRTFVNILNAVANGELKIINL